jgi:hypothetical protein
MTTFQAFASPLTLVGGGLASFAILDGNFVSDLIDLNSYAN